MRLAALALLALAPAALAQTAGQRLWSVDVRTTTVGGYADMSQPAVAPDGTVYLVTDSLYAISPAGERLWTAPASMSEVSLGADGTVYAAAANTVYAYAPDGTQRWAFTESPAGFGVLRGPTVGPDGNVYVVTTNGGLGIFSLTPGGALRWNVPGVSVQGFFPVDRLAFGPDNLYFADENVPGCGPSLSSGLVSVSLDGTIEWCRVISGVFGQATGARATRDGRAIVWQNALPDQYLRAYTPEGDLDWSRTFLPSDVGVGPDNTLYAWHDETALVSLTADGVQRWRVVQPLTNFPWRAEVSPDAATVVAGSVYGFGQNGAIVAADAADGHTLWSLPVTGPSAGAGAPAAFSPDGQVAYVPVNTVSFDEPDQLWAIQVRDARPSATEPAADAPGLVLATPSPNPARGVVRIGLTLGAAAHVRAVVVDALGREVAALHDGPLAAGAHAFTLDASRLAAGVYTVRTVAGTAAATRRLVVAR
ncbi:MAG TPA: PQQ-binding-like beta-propeller repeat protein [Rubricoccaceae bacterium]|jgi:outer membrane protein assembly factor BamB